MILTLQYRIGLGGLGINVWLYSHILHLCFFFKLCLYVCEFITTHLYPNHQVLFYTKEPGLPGGKDDFRAEKEIRGEPAFTPN